MKKLLIVTVLAVALVALAAAPALAEGYNNGQYNFNTDADSGVYAENAGIYVRNPYAGSAQIGTAKGPHGDYTTTTNKCQDCHSTHYATGSYMLLRANDRENACTFCHAGGGGSTVNIQMDNTYNATSVDTTTTRGLGTGHTLGYDSEAPADTFPAFTSEDGFACFNCHSPHGNSQRTLTTFANPGRAVFELAGVDESEFYVLRSQFWGAGSNVGTITAASFQTVPGGVSIGGTTYDCINLARWADGSAVSGSTTTAIDSGQTIAGLTPVEGNFVVVRSYKSVLTGWSGALRQGIPGVGDDNRRIPEVKPVWPSGRFLLLKNPDNEWGAGAGSDQTTSGVTAGAFNVAGGAAVGSPDPTDPTDYFSPNKLSVNWTDPLGPANAAYGGNQDNKGTTDPINAGRGQNFRFPTAGTGILAVSEFCTDCHDGAAGSSTQPASVYYDNGYTQTGEYITAFSHDAQPRH